jgi:hypothetical protein
MTMATYKLSETVACYVTWTRTVEAESEAEARGAFFDGAGEADEEGPFIGDSISGFIETVEVALVEPRAIDATANAPA